MIDLDDITKIFENFHYNNPDPKTELIYYNNYQLLIAVVLSAQATDKQVNKATAMFFDKIHTPLDVINIGIDELTNYVKSIGLYKNKATNIMNLSQKLINEFNSSVPLNFDDLITLPGVGRKTANVVLNCLGIAPTIAVDTHVARVSQRIGLSNNNKPDKIEEDLNRIIPDEYKQNAHHWLILHGRYCCTARKPLCSSCKINEFCKWYNNESKN